MKAGVLQFFSWPGRTAPLEQVYERALVRIAIMDGSGYDAAWLAEHHFTGLQRLPLRPPDGDAGGGLHRAAPHRHRGLPRGVLPPAAPGRRGRAAGRSHRRVGRRPRLRPDRVRGLRGADRGERRTLPRSRRDRARGVDARAARLPRQALGLRRSRGVAESDAEAPPADLGCRDVARRHGVGCEPPLHHPDGPALAVHRDRAQARALPGATRGARTLPARSQPQPFFSGTQWKTWKSRLANLQLPSTRR